MSWTLLAWAVLALSPADQPTAAIVVEASAASPQSAAADAASPQSAAVEPASPQAAPASADPAPDPEEAMASAEQATAAADDPTESEGAPASTMVADAGANDPFEGFNRGMYAVNDVLDRAALEPIARGYRRVTPTFFRTGVSNALQNLGEPVTFANALLQGNLTRAGETVGRFALNSTFGLLGVLNPADDIGLVRYREDFGQTLGAWGVPTGPYLYLPLLGPSNLRDAIGRGIDVTFSPWTYLTGPDVTEARVGAGVLGGVTARAGAIEQIDSLRRTSPDPYVSIRSLYGQARASAIVNGAQNVQELPDFGDIPGE